LRSGLVSLGLAIGLCLLAASCGSSPSATQAGRSTSSIYYFSAVSTGTPAHSYYVVDQGTLAGYHVFAVVTPQGGTNPAILSSQLASGSGPDGNGIIMVWDIDPGDDILSTGDYYYVSGL
jgi:hypothetical protein